MLFRIEEERRRAGTTVIIDGQLVGDCVECARDYCLKLLATESHVTVSLRNVGEVDSKGVAFLRSLVSRGVILQASGVYNSQLIDDIQRCCAGGHRPDPPRGVAQSPPPKS